MKLSAFCEGIEKTMVFRENGPWRTHSLFCVFGVILAAASTPLWAQTTGSSAFTRSVAEAAASDDVLAAFYSTADYADLWTGPDDADRRGALVLALQNASDHGLPAARYDLPGLMAAFDAVKTEGDRGRLDVLISATFLAYARDLSSGALTPSKVVPSVVREIQRPDRADLLQAMAAADHPGTVFRDLVPDEPEYARLIKEKLALEAEVQDQPALAKIGAASLERGASGSAVIALRDRLISKGYLEQTSLATYDGALLRAVQRFQQDNGITPDGVAGASTIAALNRDPKDELRAVVVALERLKWLNGIDRTGRYIWVNQPEFVARIMDDGKTSFQTRAVIGKNVDDQRTPEFSDEMEYMVINPSWGVPRSITVKEYLPLLQRNRNAVGHLQVIDNSGNVVPRGAVNFAAYSASSFPFGLRQPPSDGNALGQVKFMFPNEHNIYLHDTPAKNLFDHEVRAYSHGCIRLGDPVDFAHALLARQSESPKELFQEKLDTKQESPVSLEQKLPVHLVYFTAWPNERGKISYLQDIYGRDAAIFAALQEAGVVLVGEDG
jgi:L,D-transpeptidase YcbB